MASVASIDKVSRPNEVELYFTPPPAQPQGPRFTSTSRTMNLRRTPLGSTLSPIWAHWVFFSCWGFLRDPVYVSQPLTTDDLKPAIVSETSLVRERKTWVRLNLLWIESTHIPKVLNRFNLWLKWLPKELNQFNSWLSVFRMAKWCD